ncbi:glycoside hydrolase family 2 protein [Brachybacterium phenoliresistens]|uniref:glycoside hydrolase family 2 protein n=1 Tax=Brachybacterium phenoliresistens TaxID=396014 RepID=UPI0031D892A2
MTPASALTPVTSVRRASDSAIDRLDLHEGWTLTVLDGPAPFPVQDIPATVPGTFLTDLLDAGLIEDPYLDENEKALAWSGECDLSYRTSFTLGALPGDRTDLVARSLDTAATVILNGETVAVVQNQHRSWRWAVEHLLREGENTLEIRFASPLRTARENQQVIGELPKIGNELPYNAIRKMACNLGWDWGPVLVTSGIAGPIGLETWNGARLATLRPQVDVTGEDGSVRVRAQVERAADAAAPAVAAPDAPAAADAPEELALRLVVTDPDGAEVATLEHALTGAEREVDLAAAVPAVRRWWPRGHGEQPLYTVAVSLRRADGTVLDASAHRVGFRTAGFVEETDEIGTSFTMVVNDRPILIKGANWIPDDCFPTRLTQESYRRSIGHALDAGMNTLRIWGGGLYEDDVLYDICDQEGLLVWQDFAMACAAYSEAEPLRSEIEAEARENIVRLAWHPALVHWNGSNESVEGYYHWGFREVIAEGTGWGNGYFTQLLPSLVAELDHSRSYTPSSPYSRPKVEDPRNPDHGTVHNWVVWASEEDNNYVHYRDTSPRFAAEFGWQGPASWATVERAITERPLRADSPAMLNHQKAIRGQEKLVAGYRPHFPDPDPASYADFHFTTSLNQARALLVGISHYRSLWPRCGGTIIWQLNDCWPVTSWAAVDGDDRRKLLWHAMRELYRPVLLSVQPGRDGDPAGPGLRVSLGNDRDEELAGTLLLRRQTLAGEVLAAAEAPVAVPARSAGAVPVPEELALAQDPAGEVLVVELAGPAGSAAEAGGAPRAVHWFAEDKDLALEADALIASARAEGEDVVLDLEARSSVRDVCVIADRVHPDAVAERQLLTLLPGERASIRIRVPGGAADPAAYAAPGVLRHVGELLARSRAAQPAGPAQPARAREEARTS